MKKIFCAMTALMLMFSLTSCVLSDLTHLTGLFQGSAPQEDMGNEATYRADVSSVPEFYKHLMIAAAEEHTFAVFSLQFADPISAEQLWADYAVRFVGEGIKYYVLFGEDNGFFGDQTVLLELPERPVISERKHAPHTKDQNFPKWRNGASELRRRAIEASPYKRNEGFEAFAIHRVNEGTLRVHDTEQLWIALEKNYLPVFVSDAESAAERIWEKAKDILRHIITEDMTVLQKLRAIYDFLCENVEYYHNLASVSGHYREDIAHYPEGVLENGCAVCDGIAKTAVILCRIEGIPCVLIEGKGEQYGHAWNAVEYEGNWYTFCATYGMMTADESTSLAQALDGRLGWTSYRTFMAPLSYMDALYPEQSCGDLPPIADRTISVAYPLQYPAIPGDTVDLHIETEEELALLFAEMVNSGVEEPYFLELTSEEMLLDPDTVARAARRSDPFVNLVLFQHHDEVGLTRYTVFVR